MRARLGLVCLVLGFAALPAQAVAQTVSFFSTGAEQTFTVPAGVSSLNVVAVGGSGGGDGAGNPGGFGARASADLALSPGQVLYVEVGANGRSGSGSGAGGFNGGGAGGSGAGGGGGASDIRTSPVTTPGSLTTRLVVAGGGGGGAQGAGGGNAGAAGPGTGGGKAGSQTAGGAGGTTSQSGFAAGKAGGLGSGGAGTSGILGGAGGGAGLFGGGGGAGCTNSMYYCDPIGEHGGNGGGGSSGFASGTSNTAVGIDTSGVPEVTIVYTGPPPVQPPAPPSTAVIGQSLLSQLVPHGKAARISAIRKHRGYAFSFNALVAGTATISWVETEHKRMHGHTRTKTVLIAKGSRKFTAAGAGKLTIRLTSRGRSVFRRAKHLKLTAKGTFKPTGSATVARQRSFKLH